MLTISLRTQNCIVTGKPAEVFTGHVVADCFGPLSAVARVAITAGFDCSKTYEALACDRTGCFGEWKPEYGVKVDDYWPSEYNPSPDESATAATT